MRRIVHFMHVSLDGYVADPEGGMDWIHVDDEIFDYAGARTSLADTALYGRKTFEMMDAYWPTAADQPGAGKHEREHSAWYNQVSKIVLSRTMTTAPARTRVVSGNLASEISDLKKAPGSEIVMFGSPGAGQSLMREGLIDELWLFVNPILLGKGLLLFDGSQGRVPLTLLEAKRLGSGVVCLHYEKTRAATSEAGSAA